MKNLFFLTLFILPGISLLVLLQVILSKSASKLSGLILPVFSFLFSLLGAAGYYYYSADIFSRAVLVPVFSIFLLLNVPTAIFLGIYSVFQKKKSPSSQLDKMKIKDL